MADSTVRVTFIGDNRDLNRTVDDSDGKLSKFGDKIGSFAKTAGLALGGAGLAAGAFGKSAVDAASDLNESFSKVTTVFGDFSDGIIEFADGAAKSVGLSKQAAYDAAGTFGNLFDQMKIGKGQSAQMSTQLINLAADLASFHNADITDVIEAQTAAFRGEYDSLQKYIPTINAAAVEQKALELSHKKTSKELTEQDKLLATQALMMEGAGAAVGDFARTSDGAANKQRILKAELSNLQAEIGTKLLPIYQQLLSFVVEHVVPGLEKFGAWLGEVLPPIIASVKEWIQGSLIPALKSMSAWINENVVPALQAIGDWIVKNVIPAIQQFAGWINDELLPSLQKLWASFEENILPALVKVAGFIQDYVLPVLAKIGEWIVTYVLPVIGELVTFILGDLLPALFNIAGWINDHVLVALEAMVNFIKDDVIPKVVEVKEKFEEFGTKVGEIWDGLKETVKSAVEFILEWIDKIISPLEKAIDLVGKLPSIPGTSSGKTTDYELRAQEIAQNRDINGNGIIGRWTGGPVEAGRTYRVGEHGPELLTMGGNGFVTPNGVSGVTININGPVYGMDDFERKVADAAEKFAQRNGMN